MNRLIKLFLAEDIDIEYSNDQFNYEFNLKSHKEDFDMEFRKFLGIYNSFFYYNNRLVFIINNYEINLPLKDIEQLLELYIYAKEYKLENERMILAEFIYTYYKTITTKEYKEKNSEAISIFWKVLDGKNLRKSFIEAFLTECYIFYKKIVEYAFRTDVFINGEIINKIFNNLNTRQEGCDELIEQFIDNKKYLYNIISYDKNTKNHISTYLEYIYQSLDEFGGYNYAKEMIAILDRYGSLTLQDNKNIINKYVEVVNKLGIKLKDKEYSFHNGMNEIDNLKNELNYILREVRSLIPIQKSKIHECLNTLLGLKRYLLSDNNYIESEMIKRDYSQKINQSEVEKIRKSIFDNIFLLYASSKIDFIEQMGIALNSYSKYALSSIVSKMQIDSKRQIYSINIEEQPKSSNDNFKKYFDSVGRTYTLANEKKLINKLDNNYYEELLKYLSKTFILHQSLITSFFSKEELKGIYRNLSISLGYDYENSYEILVSNILAIEADVLCLLKRHSLKEHSNGFDNASELFDFYKSDKQIVNGLMYINYILYEKSGLNLRNNAMHGNLINTDLTISLLVTFSALIFMSCLLNESKGCD